MFAADADAAIESRTLLHLPLPELFLNGLLDNRGSILVAMTDRGDGIWEATITVLDGTDIQYKYTRGSWETVEEWGSITGTNNRNVTVDGGMVPLR